MTTEVMQMIEDWASAERNNDADALEGVLADDFAGIGPRGFQIERKAWLDRFRTGSYKNTAFAWDDVDVHDYAGALVVRGVQTSRGLYQGQETGGRFRGTLVYVKQDGSWKLAAMQLSEMMEAPAGGPPR
ncbi:MAG TPA: nuclear transport factor 2 family protein [Dehalococcoidia bacterium]|jgi:ketosteroid isomerase-like protein|nr:nuclear transport factor 2 family protein [Dehalococcoidia bacterium]